MKENTSLDPSAQSYRVHRYFSAYMRKISSYIHNTFWPDCKAIPAYGLMMSVCPSVSLSVSLSTFWLTFAFIFWNLLCNPAIPSSAASCLIRAVLYFFLCYMYICVILYIHSSVLFLFVLYVIFYIYVTER